MLRNTIRTLEERFNKFMNIAKASLINFYSHSIRIICALGVTKIIAAQTGPAGVAMMGQIANAINLFLPYTNAGIGNGVVKYIAEYNATNQVNETSKVINTSLSITLVASAVIAIALYAFKNSLSVFLFGSVDYSWVFIVFAFCIPFMALGYSLMYILNGYKRIKEYSTITAINALAFVALSFFFTFPYGISGALISVIASQTSIFCRRQETTLEAPAIQLRPQGPSRSIKIRVHGIGFSIFGPFVSNSNSNLHHRQPFHRECRILAGRLEVIRDLSVHNYPAPVGLLSSEAR
jgi:hypothetical protein